jgi:1-acyl-sn-glycerol-3-phosphate acyltransferase
MALKAQAPVVPVAIKGARAAMRKGSPWIQPVLVRVLFGAPIETVGLTLEDRDKLTGTVRADVERLLKD